MDTDTPQSLAHLDQSGNAQMVDVTLKPSTVRRAIAVCEISMKTTTLDAIQAGNLPKGDVLGTARLAGIMAAKQTANLIPMCHPLNLTGVDVKIILDENIPGYQIEAEVKTKAETGVEMEALTAVTIAALTIYDMAKSLEKTMIISNARLLHKSGGKSGEFNSPSGAFCDL
ncbi:MAG: cyclic pyranopterin monophosphate synthase MoaC [Pseudanabaena sp.]|jgi:cyclic pyranopterin phosphate synthase|uniref:cyclic pyranopterin monophosphate synthase MoaC n=1 Tax=Pseudanabaena mucicola TaxID=71190 RepID=UPI000E8DED62|nr:cyclic pyranopterin monophosphate synthase MoaC [Pseudanabaena mucicola]MCA6552147.1 cyclic pyranopterin monophosphate synthase MoaC [Pseudanabaena sp. M135S2SP2A07QC]MCA6574218.1 cyclic pyranopterin monophosphate synthase MoaC [Pseudanabaena sp. M53BS1SP1A06MG]MCA6582167.1 cyclic pyranopterin monophosphate synthase MoaC [Pseudanabaena sp. M34BS1SP1A06MG]MCA6593456.1 cyclic pyranopterin monophosphate synthase MoaC [Pseudanabaena sp. M38BS1SP1A06MG]MCA6597467.1 cyclic pyranopterin monophosph